MTCVIDVIVLLLMLLMTFQGDVVEVTFVAGNPRAAAEVHFPESRFQLGERGHFACECLDAS